MPGLTQFFDDGCLADEALAEEYDAVVVMAIGDPHWFDLQRRPGGQPAWGFSFRQAGIFPPREHTTLHYP
jgi:hypothetical protein